MTTKMARLAVAVAVILVALPRPAAAIHERCHTTITAEDLYITMSDNVRLRYAVEFPGNWDWDEICARAPFPIVLQYSAYGHQIALVPHWSSLVKNGYAVVNVGARGTGCSGGKWDPLSKTEREDIHEIVDWITEQWWSDGRVALIGQSYPAIQALAGAPEAPQALKAVVAGLPVADLYRDVLFPGGIRSALPAFTAGQAGLSAAAAVQAVLPTPTRTADIRCADNHTKSYMDPTTIERTEDSMKWKWDEGILHDRSPIRDAAKIQAPVFLAVGWQDEVVGSRGVDILRELKVPYRAVLSNGGHTDLAGPFNTRAMGEEIVAFLNHYVRGDVKYDKAPVEIWWDATPTTGPRWKTKHGRWPVPQTKARALHLAGGARLTDLPPVAPGGDSYAYVPASGQSTSWVGGWAVPPEPGTYRSYTYDVKRDLVVAGSASLDVWLSSTAADTDLQVLLAEVSGTNEIYVAQGLLRASHRQLDPVKSTPTRPYHTHQERDAQELKGTELLRVEIMPFAHAFREGTKLRVYIESPRAADIWVLQSDRNPAVNTIHHGPETPSALVLPEIPGVSPDPHPTACDMLTRRICRPALPGV